MIISAAKRRQYGTKAELVDVKDRATKQVVGKKYVFGYAKYMRDALPGALFVVHRLHRDVDPPIEQADANTLETLAATWRSTTSMTRRRTR